MAKDNNLLGSVGLYGITPAPQGVTKIVVCFHIGTDGILSVSAEERSSGQKKMVTINNDKGRLSNDEIENMIKEAERYKLDDEEQLRKVAAWNLLEKYVYDMKNNIKDEKIASTLDSSYKKRIENVIEQAMQLLEDDLLVSADEFINKKKELEDLYIAAISLSLAVLVLR